MKNSSDYSGHHTVSFGLKEPKYFYVLHVTKSISPNKGIAIEALV